MGTNEIVLFTILMLVFFAVCIVIIIKPELFFITYNKSIKMFGLKINYNEKGLYCMRIIGIAMVIFGIVAVLLQLL